MTELSQTRLYELLSYDEATGDLFWKPRPSQFFTSLQACAAWNARYSGAKAGTVNATGYLSIKIDGFPRRAHRIVWCLFNGDCPAYPECEIDHINGDKLDNRISNLRRVTHTENCRNRKKSTSNNSGVVGVVWNKTQRKWTAHIGCGSKNIRLGSFPSFSAACSARASAERDFGYHVNHGRGAA